MTAINTNYLALQSKPKRVVTSLKPTSMPTSVPMRFEGSTAKKWGMGLAALSLLAIGSCTAVNIIGFSPQQKSYWLGTYTELPPPPENARLQLSISTEDDGTIFINYVLWNPKKQQFYRADIHYTTVRKVLPGHSGHFREMGGYEQRILDGEVLYGDAIVDQEKKAILLTNGNVIDGPTGNILDKDGNIVKKRGE